MNEKKKTNYFLNSVNCENIQLSFQILFAIICYELIIQCNFSHEICDEILHHSFT